MMDIEKMSQKTCWVIDFLPFQVQKDSEGNYFAIEEYYLEHKNIRESFLDIILKLNCYYDIVIEDVVNPDIETFIDKEDLWVEVRSKGCWLNIRKDFTHMSVFDPDQELLKLLKLLADGAGLYLWRPDE